MKILKISLSFLFILSFCSLFGQKNNIELLSSKDNSSTIKFTLNDYSFNKVVTDNGIAFTISAENTFSIMEKNAPDLPKFSSSVIISDTEEMTVNVISSKFIELEEEIIIAPSKGNLTRDIDPGTISYEFGEIYNNNEFYPANIVGLNEPFILRDYRAQTVVVNPFQYNPVTKKLRIYSEIIVEVVSNGQTGSNILVRNQPLETVQTEFNQIYSNFFLNYNYFSKYTPLEEEGNMLIICNDAWISEMDEFVLWKNQRGIHTEIVSKTTAGSTAAAIKTYVQNYYTTNGLTFLLLVGDAAQIPTNSGGSLGGDSDNAYAYVTGNDHYQEFFVGRLSAETLAHVTTQVERTIEYEKGDQLADGWLNKTIGIGSTEGAGIGDDDEIDYEHQRNIQSDLLGFTYVAPTIEIFDGSQGGNDANGDATAAQVSTAVNTGAGIITYTGHGSDTSWGTTGFSVSNADALTNDNKLPFIWSVACVNGNFNGLTCFAEGWMRSVNGTEPAGSIAIFASTINQSWAPPMAGQDEMVDILVESYENNIKRTFGGISINGCFLMNEETSDFAMTDTWTIFGDPSLLVRTDNPADMTVTHQPVIIIGTTTFEVNCSLNGSLACLSKNGEIIGTATVTGGVANIPVADLIPDDFLDLVVTGFNAVAYITQVQVESPEGAYIVSDGYTISDLTGNNNSQADFGETFNLNLSLKNVGIDETLSDVTATISTTSEYVVGITNNNFNFLSLTASEIVSSEGAYTIEIANNVPDQTVIPLTIEITDGTENWTASVNITANAPEFAIGTMTISDDTNGDGGIDPGETAILSITTQNVGHADATQVVSSLFGNSPYFTIIEESVEFDVTSQGEEQVSFNVEANESCPEGTIVSLSNDVVKGDYAANASFDLVIGQLPVITIGTGTTASTNYPFYTYYENNKSQILYLGSEIGTGTVNIQELAFDFTSSDPIITDLTDLTIKFNQVGITSLGTAYNANTNATTVLSSVSYTMPQINGWYSFDIDDYSFDATQNLLVEITWGDNGAYGGSNAFYKVNCSTTASTSVVYGYADSETPPVYDGNSTNRPNIQFFVEGAPAGEIREITFTVVDGTKAIIPDAEVKIGSLNQSVDEFAQTIFNIIEGEYVYVATAPGFSSVSNSFVADVNQTIEINMGEPNSITDIGNNAIIYPNPSTGIFTIKSDLQNVNFNIFDVTGRIVYTGIVNGQTNIDLSDYAKGAYILKIENSNQIIIVE
jgi:hypothetical protein